MLLTILIITALFLALLATNSRKTWIPILICLMLIRDLRLCPLMGDGTLKIGDVFIAYLFGLWMLGDLFTKKSTGFVKSKLDLFIVLFVLFHFCSLLWSTDLGYGIVRCIKLTRNFLFYIIIRELFIRDFWGSYKKTTISYIVTGVVLLIVHVSVVLSSGGFLDFLSVYQKETFTSLDLGVLRVRGTGGGFLVSGPSMWFIMTGVLIFGSLMLSNSRVLRKIKILLIILMFVSATVLTLQRTVFAMASILLILLFLGSLHLRSKRNIRAISVMLIVFVVMGATLGLGRIYSKRFENCFEDGSWLERTRYYQAASGAFFENPILGIGAGSNYSWQANYPGIFIKSRTVHSAYLLVLSELGLLGLIIFVVIIYFWIRYLWNCIRNPNIEPYFRNISMTMFAFSVSYLLYIFSVGEFEAFEPWLVMAIASAVKNLNVPAITPISNTVSSGTGSINLALSNERNF